MEEVGRGRWFMTSWSSPTRCTPPEGLDCIKISTLSRSQSHMCTAGARGAELRVSHISTSALVWKLRWIPTASPATSGRALAGPALLKTSGMRGRCFGCALSPCPPR